MRRLLFDMSSLLWQNLLAGKDEEFGQKLPDPERPEKIVHVNSAAFGFENFVNNLGSLLERFSAAPREIVMVFDGKNAKGFRQAIFPDYKKGRSHHPASYEEFDKLRTMVTDTLMGLGAIAVQQDGMEADDVMAYLARDLKSPSTIVSSDGDMAVLQSATVDVWNTGRQELNGNKFGPFPNRFITVYKALVGDPSDNIKGAHKFGQKSFLDLLVAFDEDGLEAMEGLIKTKTLERLAEDLAALKSLQKIIDSRDMVYTSWDLARMYPEKVNTMRRPLQIKAGMVHQWDANKHDPRLKKWYGQKRIVHAGNYAEIKGWMLGRLLETPVATLDLEGYTPPESDEWLEAKNRAAGGKEDDDLGVDTLGSKISGVGLSFGRNCQYSVYMTVDHTETEAVKNITSTQARQVVELIPSSKPIAVHNAAFELPVLFQAWGEAWKSNGWHGFLPNVVDTMIMKSFVDENTKQGLKFCSKEILGYEQVSYEQVTQGRKMNQLTAEETLDYGCDDIITTSALHNYFTFVMELEDTLRVFELIARKPPYLNALRFVTGTPISLEKMFELERADKIAFDAAWAKVRDFLIAKGWEGTVCPQFAKVDDLTAAAIKGAFEIVTGKKLETQVRTPSKLALFAASLDSVDMPEAALFASCLDEALKGDFSHLNRLLQIHFSGEPEFNIDSPVQMQKLLYETLELPVRLRQKPTDAMRAKGIKEGNRKGDDFALQFAIKFDADRGPEVLDILKAVQTMRVMNTRSKLYYVPYRHMRHWKTGLVHSHVRQFVTNTRRDSDSDPNKQQLGKNVKHGHKPRIREVYVAHRPDAVVVSVDYTGQELVLIAEQSQDPNMVACFVGDHKKNMHAITGAVIWREKPIAELCRMMGTAMIDKASAQAVEWTGMTYERFMEIYLDPKHPDFKLAEELRQIGKKVNFTTEYGAQALKLSETLIITPEEGQQYVDAKEAAFPVAAQWKRDVISNVRKTGYELTMLGGRRHLAELLQSSNGYEASKAERQSVNFKVQGSAAEQTKQAETGMWDEDIFFKYDAIYIGPVHDELVASVRVDHLIPFLREMHAVMARPYAGMKIPPVASISFGRNYQEQIEVGETVDEERITKALQSLGFSVHNMTTA